MPTASKQNLFAASNSKQKDIGTSRSVSSQLTPAGPAERTTPGAMKEGAIEVDSSISPDYVPAPRRTLKTTAAL